jgi:putative acetyltransferase
MTDYSVAMRIRSETTRDRAAVDTVERLAFGDHGEMVATLVARLRRRVRARRGASLVAEQDGQVVGHVMVTHAWLDAPRRLVDVHVLSPLAVMPEAQGRGIGGALVQAAIARVERLGGPAVFLEGSPAYYSRLGFEPAGSIGFRSPSLRIPEAAFQVVRLSAWEPWMTGTLVYPDVFWELDAVGLRNQGE